LIGRGELLHPLAEAYGVAVSRVDHLQVIPDRADHDLSGVEAHAYGKAELAGSLELLGVPSKLFLQVKRGVTGAPCVVLVSDRGAEDCHDPVAGELVDRPLETVDPVGEDLEAAVHDPIPLRRAARISARNPRP
jgi:hypothetical protein